MLVQCWVKVADGGLRLSRYLNFHPLKVVSRYRDPQLQVVKITRICLILIQNIQHM